MIEWLSEHRIVLTWLVALSAVSFIGTLIAIPWIIVRMPADYFVDARPEPDSWRDRHPVLRWVVRVVKNLLGALLVVAGIVLSVPLVPGQGILTMLIGLTLLEFPGKRRLERRIVRQRPVRKAIDWIRSRAGRPPLELPPKS